MQMTPKDYATALYLAVKDVDDATGGKSISRFITLMKQRGLIGLLPAIMSELPKVIRTINNTETVVVNSARKLDDDTISSILQHIGISEDTTEIITEIRQELIGGIKVVHGDNVYDATIKERLRRLKSHSVSSRTI